MTHIILFYPPTTGVFTTYSHIVMRKGNQFIEQVNAKKNSLTTCKVHTSLCRSVVVTHGWWCSGRSGYSSYREEWFTTNEEDIHWRRRSKTFYYTPPPFIDSVPSAPPLYSSLQLLLTHPPTTDALWRHCKRKLWTELWSAHHRMHGLEIVNEWTQAGTLPQLCNSTPMVGWLLHAGSRWPL